MVEAGIAEAGLPAHCYRTILVDDDELFREAFTRTAAVLREFRLVAAVATLAQARRALREQAPVDLLVLDVYLGDDNGLELISWARNAQAGLAVAVLSGGDVAALAPAAIAAGAMGFLTKLQLRTQLLELAGALANRRYCLCDEAAQTLAGRVASLGPAAALSDTIVRPALSGDCRPRGDGRTADMVAGYGPPPHASLVDPGPQTPGVAGRDLTPNELAIVSGLLAGHSHAQIATALGVVKGTVDSTLARLKRKLGCRDTDALLALARGRPGS